MPASEAHEYPADKLKEDLLKGKILRVHGQRLRGEMIPTIEDPVFDSTMSATKASATNQMPPSLKDNYESAKETDPLLFSSE